MDEAKPSNLLLSIIRELTIEDSTSEEKPLLQVKRSSLPFYCSMGTY